MRKCKICSSLSHSLCFNFRVSSGSVRTYSQPRLSTSLLQSNKWACTLHRKEGRGWAPTLSPCSTLVVTWWAPRHRLSFCSCTHRPQWAQLDQTPYSCNAKMPASPLLQGRACSQFSSQPPIRKHKPSDKRILHFLLAAFSGFFNLLSFWA